MGCCSSRPDNSESPQHGRATAPPPVRHSPQVITSQTAINSSTQDHHAPSLAPPSGLSIPQSDTSHSALSTPRHSVQNHGSRPPRSGSLAEHYNLPLQIPKTWTSKDRTWTRTRLQRERYEFFETRVTGRPEIWEGLKQAIECLREGDLPDAQGIIDALEVTLPTGRLEEGAYDAQGSLYKIPQAVISDPTDVIEDIADMDSQTVSGPADSDTLAMKLEAAEDANMGVGQAQTDAEKTKEAKGKAAVDKDAMNVRCRLSDRGGPDVVVQLGRTQRVGLLAQRIRDETDMHDQARIRIAYLGKILDDRRTLSEQGWKEGHVIQALVVGRFAT
ncbi:hypothetical protein PV08_08329 [Exophiala spinifera]|uniref:Ubiquitin-like domain-containing protein n=1 Tax=Exophiala spinifera TaxID=91928 RepID=A0A0D1ZJZ3_9EURO|nr:uncharacterized protein PV08_08329 [Exophiala spinifera]KIW13142.1 hypothetical protein PV08_08329 [Exophiala spinifera]